MSIYGKPVWQLLIDFAQEHLDLEGSTFTPQDATRWFQQKYPKIKKGGKIIIEDVGYNSHSETCISRICATGSDLGYDVRVFDLREKTDSDFSTIIELQKRQQNER